MLHRTLPLPFSLCNSPSLSPSLLLKGGFFLSSSSRDGFRDPGMECFGAALKAGLLRKDAVLAKLVRPHAAFSGDLLPHNSHHAAAGAPCDGGGAGDDFVDDLFDFSNDEAFCAEQEEGGREEEAGRDQVTLQQRREPRHDYGDDDGEEEEEENVASVSAGEKDDLGLVPHLPAEDLADLEWLSHFVEDSFSQFCEPLPAGVLLQNPMNGDDRSEPESESSGSSRPGFTTPLPSKARSKRPRTGGRVWSLGVPSLAEPSSSSSSSTAASPLLASPWFVHLNRSRSLEPAEPEPWDAKPPMKKHKKPAAAAASETAGPARRCSHCGVQKTPQWRAGPNGAKTLCNACGVRFKSGRLYPEYRPACSPTFCSELHSNHHRKVLEMRREKESTLPGQPEPGWAVPSF